MVQKIKQLLFCRFVATTPEHDPEELPRFDNREEDDKLAARIRIMKEDGWNIFIPFDKKNKAHPFRDPKVIAKLKADLGVLDIVVFNYSDSAGALLFNENIEIKAWLDNFYKDKPDT